MRRGSRAVVGSAAAVMATAALVYLFDPVRGERRRRTLREQSANVASRLTNRIRVARLRRRATRQLDALDARLRDVAAHL